MFLNYIKEFSVKRILNNKVQNFNSNELSGSVQSVGLLIDESTFFEKEDFIKELVANGFLEKNIEVVVYQDKENKKAEYLFPTFNTKQLGLNAKIKNADINDFINKEFDLLISYYDIEKTILLLVTFNSKARFKVGFSSVNNNLNQLMINTNIKEHKIFTHELFKYLKILNKL